MALFALGGEGRPAGEALSPSSLAEEPSDITRLWG
jgi:hypothetical protein